MSKFNYACENMNKAVTQLVAGDGTLKQRLQTAVRELIIPELPDLPDHLQEPLQSLMHKLTAKNKTVIEIVDALDHEQMAPLANEIVGLYIKMRVYAGQQRQGALA